MGCHCHWGVTVIGASLSFSLGCRCHRVTVTGLVTLAIPREDRTDPAGTGTLCHLQAGREGLIPRARPAPSPDPARNGVTGGHRGRIIPAGSAGQDRGISGIGISQGDL